MLILLSLYLLLVLVKILDSRVAESNLTSISLSDLTQSRSGGALAGSNTNLASSFNSGLNTVGLNNGYQNQNVERSGGGSKWGNSAKLGEVISK